MPAGEIFFSYCFWRESLGTYSCLLKDPLKVMKGFLFQLKSSFRSQDVHGFVLAFWSCRRKVRLISKFMASELGKQTIEIDLLPNISRSKGNQTRVFAQLIEYNMRNLIFQKSCLKYCGETIPRPFSKKSKFSMSLDQEEVLYSLFLLYTKLRAIKVYWY